MMAERRNLFDFFKQLCENHKVDLAHAASMEDVLQHVSETMKFVNARRKKNEKVREQLQTMELHLITARHTKDLQLDQCRGDPDTKVRAQIMDYKHKNRSTKAKIESLRSEKMSYMKLFERASSLVSTLLSMHGKAGTDRMIDEKCDSNINVKNGVKLLLLANKPSGKDASETNTSNSMSSLSCLQVFRSFLYLDMLNQALSR